MLIILSQRIDTESDYSDKVFETYHFPSAYKNRIHEGDIFVYYQGNRYVKEQRYYYGVGTVGKITTLDEENYFASLLNVQQFKSTVPIYLPDGKYVETLGYETVRKSPTPPWQSSVRPLSQKAFDYILLKGGVTLSVSSPIDIQKEQLKESIRSFFLEDNVKALIEIKKISSDLIHAFHLEEKDEPVVNNVGNKSKDDTDAFRAFITYCTTTHLTYSYKPVLILAFFDCVDKNGQMELTRGVDWVINYYRKRIETGRIAENKKSIYLNKNVSKKQVADNLIANPIKALVKSGFFRFDKNKELLVLSPDVWKQIKNKERRIIIDICNQRLRKYYNE